MTNDIGPQYNLDDPFKAAARRHQSEYRLSVLNADFQDYGNRLAEPAARALLNYYDELGVQQAFKKRYPSYKRERDADMLRSEHIPFNFFAPLLDRPKLTEQLLSCILKEKIGPPFEISFEWAPKPAKDYLGDLTSFDAYIKAIDEHGRLVGIGIEVKYTEKGYPIGKMESSRVKDAESSYWATTRKSGVFLNNGNPQLANDGLRQIWRNHLLGLKMRLIGDLDRFISITLYPAGNRHFTDAISQYQTLLTDEGKLGLRGCTFERYIDFIDGDVHTERWKSYLQRRYVVQEPE